ncbi:low temperature requirement protein A [Janibacter alkaliphilus]|uniref:Low temperature requirement protein LtrA n=1 Tax=Janibacter alkaliphilus TaxID=1069963 RepID=A0A852WZU8_9MICO|nr:low temperature requirement protein A [Janibacter alkaliphilus]NYG36139.1 low temperature requirement protein LtrA [Janibacter alkaliphilus]
MGGRDPHETGRAATALELLYDLVFVVSFAVAGEELAHAVAADHVSAGVIAFCMATFSIVWAWINFTWFASAYDTDDWIYRLLAMVQMIGITVFALGVPRIFETVEHGEHVDMRLSVIGYVIMRVGLICQWLRAARQDPARRRTAMVYVATLTVAQIGWVVVSQLQPAVGPMLAMFAVILAVEIAGPVIAETRFGSTPWHAHHIAERYGLLAIITLGEGVVGTVAALGAALGPEGEITTEGWIVVAAGMVMTFGLWWAYFSVDHAQWLHLEPRKSFGWGYGHFVIYIALAAVGAGLHVVAYALEGESEVGDGVVILSMIVPIALFLVALFGIYTYFAPVADPYHLGLLVVSAALMVLSYLVASGGSLLGGVAIAAVVPWVTVLGYETFGHRHQSGQLDRHRGQEEQAPA